MTWHKRTCYGCHKPLMARTADPAIRVVCTACDPSDLPLTTDPVISVNSSDPNPAPASQEAVTIDLVVGVGYFPTPPTLSRFTFSGSVAGAVEHLRGVADELERRLEPRNT